MTTYRDVLATYTEEKRNAERSEPFTYYIVRPLSWVPAHWFIRAGVSANAVTTLSFLFAALGSAAVAFGSLSVALAGFASLFAWAVLDCADGTVARFSRREDAGDGSAAPNGAFRGEFLDALGGYIMCALVFPAMGTFAFRGATGILGLSADTALRAIPLLGSPRSIGLSFLVLGFWAAQTGLFARLLFQKYKTLAGADAKELKRGDGTSGLKRRIVALVQNIVSSTGFLLPLTLAALLTGGAGWFVICYACIQTSMLGYTVLRIWKDLT